LLDDGGGGAGVGGWSVQVSLISQREGGALILHIDLLGLQLVNPGILCRLLPANLFQLRLPLDQLFVCRQLVAAPISRLFASAFRLLTG
jgi:hypothetical protein